MPECLAGRDTEGIATSWHEFAVSQKRSILRRRVFARLGPKSHTFVLQYSLRNRSFIKCLSPRLLRRRHHGPPHPDHLAAEMMHIASTRGAGSESREPLLAAEDDEAERKSATLHSNADRRMNTVMRVRNNLPIYAGACASMIARMYLPLAGPCSC